jgi:hypothetical protein
VPISAILKSKIHLKVMLKVMLKVLTKMRKLTNIMIIKALITLEDKRSLMTL